MRRLLGEGGASTVFVIAILAATVSLLSLSSMVLDSAVQDQRAQAAADNTAIAAADAVRGLNTGYPCMVAEQVAHINMVLLDSCRIVSFDVYISVHTKTVGIVHSARSRAGAPD